MDAQEHCDALMAQFLEARAQVLDYVNTHLGSYLDGRPAFNIQLILIGPRQEFVHMVTIWCDGDNFHQRGVACQYTVSGKHAAMEMLWDLTQQLQYQAGMGNESSDQGS